MSNSSLEELIESIIYVEFDDVLGPNPKLWIPEGLSENIRMLISIKTITLLTGEEMYLPKSLIMVPFPSLDLKALVKYIQWEDKERRGGIARTAITLLFKDINDAIFYKYMKDLEAVFDDISQKIVILEGEKADNNLLLNELNTFENNVIKVLDSLRSSELAIHDTEAFPAQEAETETFDYRFKVIVCGDPGSGKTSTVLRFTDKAFRKTYIPTIGVNISEKNIRVGKSNVNFVIWDIAGQTKFQMMRTHFYQGAEALLLIYDLTREKTFESIPSWHKDIITSLAGKNLIKKGFVIANKKDLENERKILKEEGLTISKNIGYDYIETSALTGENINETFIKIAEALLPSEHATD